MDYGFDRNGKPVEATSEEAAYALTVGSDRSFLYRTQRIEEGACSMYHFGQLACWAIRTDFDWKPLLSVLPDPETPEKLDLQEKLSEDWPKIRSFIDDELGKEISRSTFDDILETFCRLFPAYGHFDDMVNFLSDNYYSFDPSWNFKEYHSAPTFRRLIEEAFGVYRKDLARAVSKSNGSAMALLAHFKDSVTPEQMVQLLAMEIPSSCAGWGFLGVRFDGALSDLSSLKLLSPALRFHLAEDLIHRLINSDGEDAAYDGFETVAIIEDTLTMLRSVPEGELKRFRSDRTWNQVHSRAVALASEDDVETLEAIRIPQKLEELDGELILDHFRLALLRRPVDFLRAGSKSGLDNCMGKAGYYTKAKNGESYCFVAYVDDRLRAGIELEETKDGWRVLQLNGPHNGPLEGARSFEHQLLRRLNGDAGLARKGDLSPRPAQNNGIIEFAEEIVPEGHGAPVVAVRELPELNAAQLGIVGDVVRLDELTFGEELIGEPERLLDFQLFEARRNGDREIALPLD